MSLLILPDEIFIIIFKKLDFMSLYSLYNTCILFRNKIISYSVVKKCYMTMNTMATAYSLKSIFFKDISLHIQILNLCGVNDLSKSSLVPAMKKLKNLHTLNVSFTNINIIDLMEVYQVCPTLKNITINFFFDSKHNVRPTQINEDIIIQCQNVFKNFEHVHFVGNASDLLHARITPLILKDAKLNTLTYTIAEKDAKLFNIFTYQPQIDFNELRIYLLNWKMDGLMAEILMSIDYIQNNMYIIIYSDFRNGTMYLSVFASELFKQFFEDNFNVKVKYISNSDELKSAFINAPINFGNAVILVWKHNIQFDVSFYKTLHDNLQNFIPSSYIKKPVSKNNWHWLIVSGNNDNVRNFKHFEPEFKKKRVAPQSIILHYDDMYKDVDDIKLTLYFDNLERPISLSSSSNYLKKITCLSLTGNAKYNGDFFNLLFRSCVNLTTLNVESPSISPCSSPISRAIPLSRKMKNLRLIDKRIDFNTLFSSLSQCKTLENIHIQDISNVINDVADPITIFKNCDSIYSFCVYASMTDSTRTKKKQMFLKAKLQCCKSHLHFELYSHTKRSKYSYDPFIDVFNLSPIKLAK